MRERESFSRAEVAFVVGVPLAWGVLLLFHPGGDSLYEAASSNTDAWLGVHLGTMIFIPLLAAALFVVLRRFDGKAALVSRIALAVFAVVTAFGDSSVLAVIETVGSVAWLVAVVAAGIAMFNRAHRTSSILVVMLFVISAPGIVFHVNPVGPIGLVLCRR